MQVTNGSTRVVLLIRSYAIKFPRCENWFYFLQGCTSNVKERYYSRSDVYEWGELINPTLFCSWFGLFSIQPRATELTRDLTKKEKARFECVTTDLMPCNFGTVNNRVVCIDYA